MDEYTAVLRKDLARNPDLAREISQVLSKYDFEVPDGKIVVWGPVVVDKVDNMWDAYGVLINGIPAPRILDAALRFQEQFAL